MFNYSARWLCETHLLSQKSKFWIPKVMLKGWVKSEPLVVTREHVAYALRKCE